MDRVILNGIHCRIRTGIAPEERLEPQDCLVDVELEYDLSRAARSDDLRDSLDYSRVFECVQTLAGAGEYSLLERFAGRLEAEIRSRMRCGAVVIRVKKLRPPLAGAVDYAAVEIRRP